VIDCDALVMMVLASVQMTMVKLSIVSGSSISMGELLHGRHASLVIWPVTEGVLLSIKVAILGLSMNRVLAMRVIIVTTHCV
jgi:hypothetical protein